MGSSVWLADVGAWWELGDWVTLEDWALPAMVLQTVMDVLLGYSKSCMEAQVTGEALSVLV